VSWRPWLEDLVLRQMQDLPSEAFDMLVRTLARICDDPYDPVFSAPAPPVPGRRVADLEDFGLSSSSPMRQSSWSASTTSSGRASGGAQGAVRPVLDFIKGLRRFSGSWDAQASYWG
jgi:hypothetical protein